MAANLTCDQAIFTSIRTPTGEGYRIIAASRGVKPEEKRTITRFSPSHDALCSSQESQPLGVAFYPLPTERLCVAYSCLAGAEQTGRGGERVYTYNLIFAVEDFPLCGFNPFAVLRAMSKAGLCEPQLQPPTSLPTVSLELNGAELSPAGAELSAAFAAPWRGHCLDALLNARTLIVSLPDRWIETMEAMLLGVPGPMRARFSFGAGLKFSVGRCHNLSLISDDQSVTRKKILGRPIAYLDPIHDTPPEASTSTWVSFVERHWVTGDFAKLFPRTSLEFSDTTPVTLERIGLIFDEIDKVPETETGALLAIAAQHLGEPTDATEAELAANLLLKIQGALLERFGRHAYDAPEAHWPALCDLWRRGEEGFLFADVLVRAALRLVGERDACRAADLAFALAGDPSAPASPAGLDELVTETLERLAAWMQQAPEEKLVDVGALVDRWRSLRPRCEILDRIEQRCAAGANSTQRR